ncbi:hypothetical protein [Planctomicrobium piriforme]|uniref:hypothetical protein n=1 Tax=Planctomicrobium piriforme TaxID=1576369 RepID=UPI00158779B7|nr:hypothetical protein [Planctomicrobium piriforme]
MTFSAGGDGVNQLAACGLKWANGAGLRGVETTVVKNRRDCRFVGKRLSPA